MITNAHKARYIELVAMAETAARSPTSASNTASQIYDSARMLLPDILGEDTPPLIIVPETNGIVTLQSGADHDPSAEVRCGFFTDGTILGFGVDVAEGAQWRSYVDFRVEMQGVASWIRRGSGTGSSWAPLNVLAGQNDFGRSFLPLNIKAKQADPWSLYFQSVAARLPAGTQRLTLRPYFLFDPS